MVSGRGAEWPKDFPTGATRITRARAPGPGVLNERG